MTVPARDDFMSRAKAILDRSARSNEPLDFQILANELVPAAPDALVGVLAQPARALGDGFVPNTRVLSTLVKFRARTPTWSIEIDRGALRDGDIEFDAARNTLTINNLPAALTADLRAEFEANGAD